MPDIFQAFSIEQVVSTGIAVLVVLAWIISIVFVIWWGFLMIISGGNEEKVKGAVNHIRHAFIGVLLIITVLFIFPTFLDLVGLGYGDYMRPSAVFDTISWLSERLLWQPVDTAPYYDTPNNTTLGNDFSDL